jgi:hypothetical protein
LYLENQECLSKAVESLAWVHLLYNRKPCGYAQLQVNVRADFILVGVTAQNYGYYKNNSTIQ